MQAKRSPLESIRKSGSVINECSQGKYPEQCKWTWNKKMWKTNEEEDAEFIFCLETFMDSSRDER